MSKTLKGEGTVADEELSEWAAAELGEFHARRLYELTDEVMAGRLSTDEAAFLLYAGKESTAPVPKDRRGN